MHEDEHGDRSSSPVNHIHPVDVAKPYLYQLLVGFCAAQKACEAFGATRTENMASAICMTGMPRKSFLIDFADESVGST